MKTTAKLISSSVRNKLQRRLSIRLMLLRMDSNMPRNLPSHTQIPMLTNLKHYLKMPPLEVAKIHSQIVQPQEDTTIQEGKEGRAILVEATVAEHRVTMLVVGTWLWEVISTVTSRAHPWVA